MDSFFNTSVPDGGGATDTDQDPTADRTNSVVTNLIIGTVVFLFILIVYDILRYFCPRHVFCRSFASSNPANNDYDGTPLYSPRMPSAWPLSWLRFTLSYPEEKLYQTHGLDAAMYVRLLATQARIFFSLSIFTAIVLIPTYSTADSPDLKPSEDGVQGPRGIELVSLANVEDTSPRLWVTLVSEIAVVFIILVFLYGDLVVYTKYRRRYRSNNCRNPSNFAILLMDIPTERRDENDLYNLFNAIFPTQIAAVHLVRDAQHLLALKMKYVSAVNRRQRVEKFVTSDPPSDVQDPSLRTHAVIHPNDINAVAAQISQTPPATPPVNSDRVEPSPHAERLPSFTPQACCLNPEPVLRHANHQKTKPDIEPTSAAQHPHGSVRQVSDYPESFVTAPDTPRNTTGMPGSEAPVGEDPKPGTVDGALRHPPFPDRERPASNALGPNDPSVTPAPRPPLRSSLASPRLRALMRSDSDQMLQYHRQEDKARNVVVDVERDLDYSAPVTHAAFIVFRTKVAAACAATAPLFPNTNHYQVTRAPEPRAINWTRITISRYTTRVRRYATFGVITALTLLWAIPSSFIQGLDNLEELGVLLEKNGTPWLKKFVVNNSGLARFLEGVLPPLLLFLALLIVPVLTRFIVSFERIADNVRAEARVRNFLFFFYVMSNFVYQVALGSFLGVLPNFVNNPRNIVTFLSTSVPAQATFLMKYVLINSFLGSALGMLNTGRLLVRPIVLCRAKTERDVIRGERSFADYPYAKMYALSMMIALISYVYATIAPIMNIVALLYFSIAYLCSKQMLLFSHRPLFEGGGFLFRDAWTGLLIGLYVHQISMIGIFSLKKAAVQATLAILSFVMSVAFTLHCRRRFFGQIEHGVLLDQRIRDAENSQLDLEDLRDDIPPNFSDMYVHPGLKPVRALEDMTMDPVTSPMDINCVAWLKQDAGGETTAVEQEDAIKVVDTGNVPDTR